MKKILLTALSCLSLFSVNTTNNYNLVQAEETNSLYQLKETSQITKEASFQSDYFDFSKTKIHALPFATSFNDLLDINLLGKGKAILEDNTDIYKVYDNNGYSYTLTYDYANSHIYIKNGYDGNISFYLPSINNFQNMENMFDVLNIDTIQLPYLSINDVRYASLIYSKKDGVKLALENGAKISQEKYYYFSGMGYSTKYMDLFTIPMINDNKIAKIGKLNFNGYYANDGFDGFGEYDINFVPHKSMDDKLISMPFEITTFDLINDLPEVCIDYNTFTGIITDSHDRDNWSWAISTTEFGYGSNGTISPSQWAFCSEYNKFNGGHQVRRNLVDINLRVIENKNYYDENGKYHEVGETKIVDLNTGIDQTRSPIGGSSYGGGVITGLDLDYLKNNKSYGTIKVKDLSFYIYGRNGEWGSTSEKDLFTLDYTDITDVYFTYDSRPTMNVYYYNWDEYLMLGGGAKIDKVHYADSFYSDNPIVSGMSASILNLYEWIKASIEGSTTIMQVYGFDFYFDENKEFPINNIQSIEFDFELKGNRIRKTYTETSVDAFSRFYTNGFDVYDNLLTNYSSWNDVCERIDENGKEIIFDYALVHRIDKDNGTELKKLSPLKITYLDENFSIQEAISNSLGLHEVDGNLYDKDGNLRLDYNLKEIELTDSNGNKYIGYDITDKDGNKVDNTGTHIETTSKDPIDNIVDGKNPFDGITNISDLFERLTEKVKEVLKYGAILVGSIISIWLLSFIIPFISKIIRRLKKKGGR